MSSHTLHIALLRPSIIHILRASGFHSARPSVIDTLTDLASRHLLLIASNTASQSYSRTCDPSPLDLSDTEETIASHLDAQSPTITDIRNALAATSFFTGTSTAVEQAWAETLRRPLADFPPGAREKERNRRDVDDTRDVQEFIDWIAGPVNAEIRRIAGLQQEEGGEDFLAALKKKHSKTGDGARYAGTVLGKGAEERNVKIEGGAENIADWGRKMKRRRMDDESMAVA